MSSYNTITKIKYTGSPTDLVTLQEYIIFKDDKAKKKYIIFHFVNNVTQQLLGMQFEVCQYNVDGNLIEKSIVVYNKFLAGAEEAFVPKAKLRVSYNCNSISIRLIKVACDRFIWDEGEYEDNVYKFDNFFQDERLLEQLDNDKPKKSKREQKAELKAKGEKPVKEPKQQKPKKRKVKGRPFVMKDATKKNLARFPKFYNFVAVVAVLALLLTTLIIFKMDGTLFTEGDYNLRVVYEDKILHNTQVAIYGYNGEETDLVIPEKIGNYTVKMVDGGAFKNSKIETVEFLGDDIVIERYAFKNCSALKSVESQNKITVQELAFTECPSLVSVNLPKGILLTSSFAGCTSISSSRLIYSNSDRVSYQDVISMPVEEGEKAE